MSESLSDLAKIFTLMCVFLGLNIATTLSVKGARISWLNVPDPPHYTGILGPSWGDKVASYTGWSLALQNMGNMDSEDRALSLYNYDHLYQWLLRLDILAPQGRVLPYLAAYYFSATQDVSQLTYIVDYLERVGLRNGEENWRWLVQAIYLSRYRQDNLDRSLILAKKLAGLPNDVRPGWTYQMPAFIYNAKGDKDEARAILVEMLKTSADRMSPQEIYSMRLYICDRVLDEGQRAQDDLCSGI